MSNPLEEVLAVIYPPGHELPAGAGLLVGNDLVLTCAHVVNKALNLPLLNAGRPAKAVRVKRYTSGSEDSASVAPGKDSWSDPPATKTIGADLCLLRLRTGFGEQFPQATLVDIRRGSFPMKFRAAGFPRNFNYDFAAGEILGAGPNGVLYLLRPDLATSVRLGRTERTFRTQSRPSGLIWEGFSGGPVEVDEGIAGLIAEVREQMSDETAYMVPVSAFPPCIGLNPISPVSPALAVGPSIEIRRDNAVGPVLFTRNAALIRLGRDPSSDIVLEQPASWEHGRIIFTYGSYLYQHLGKHEASILRKNGHRVRLNREAENEVTLRQLDTLEFGGLSLVVKFQAPPPQGYIPTNDDKTSPPQG